MRYVAILITTVFLAGAAAVVISAANPDVAEAKGGYVARCGGGKILLREGEKVLRPAQ